MLGVLVHGLQVVERGGCIGQLSDALIILALTAAHTAEVKTQNGEAHIEEGVVQVVDHAVVHRAAKLRMRMQDDRDRRILDLLRVITAFQTAFRSGKYYFGHVLPCSFSHRPQFLTNLVRVFRSILNRGPAPCGPG